MNLLEDLRWRDMLQDHTEGLPKALEAGVMTAYVGFDPTAASLHVGHLLQLLALARLQKAGHRPIALVGGGTGLIGDPSGKSQERRLLSLEETADNVRRLRSQMERFLDFSGQTSARLVNNLDWLSELRLLDFMRDIGKHFSVNAMMAKESVRRRLDMESGISYTEFTYMLLQAYDFYELCRRYDCRLQFGGSDQWGNITAGIDLIRRMNCGRGYGMVFPLITTAAGVKFGKTEAGAVWLDPEMTSPYAFYQFWLNTDDRDVIRYLRFFTETPREQVNELSGKVESAPEKREAQKVLAYRVTRAVHGKTEADKAVRAAQVLFGGNWDGLSAQDIEEIFSDVPSDDIDSQRLAQGLGLIAALAESSLADSKSAARRLVQGGGIRVNNQRVDDVNRLLKDADCIDGRFIVLRRGAKHYHLLKRI